MIEIGAKATGANLFLQIAVGRGQDAHVDAQRALGTDALDLACLQGRAAARLHRQRELAQLIQETACRRPQLRTFQHACPPPGEGTAHVAKQLALGDGLGSAAQLT